MRTEYRVKSVWFVRDVMLCQNELNAIVRNHVAERLGASMCRFAFKTLSLLDEKERRSCICEVDIEAERIGNGLQTKHKSKKKGARIERAAKGKNREKEIAMQNTRAQYKESAQLEENVRNERKQMKRRKEQKENEKRKKEKGINVTARKQKCTSRMTCFSLVTVRFLEPSFATAELSLLFHLSHWAVHHLSNILERTRTLSISQVERKAIAATSREKSSFFACWRSWRRWASWFSSHVHLL